MKIIKRAVGASVLFLSFFIFGCTPVSPWERGNLAKPHMVLDPYPMQGSLRAHIFGSREAAFGVNAAEGGGCGCY